MHHGNAHFLRWHHLGCVLVALLHQVAVAALNQSSLSVSGSGGTTSESANKNRFIGSALGTYTAYVGTYPNGTNKDFPWKAAVSFERQGNDPSDATKVLVKVTTWTAVSTNGDNTASRMRVAFSSAPIYGTFTGAGQTISLPKDTVLDVRWSIDTSWTGQGNPWSTIWKIVFPSTKYPTQKFGPNDRDVRYKVYDKPLSDPTARLMYQFDLPAGQSTSIEWTITDGANLYTYLTIPTPDGDALVDGGVLYNTSMPTTVGSTPTPGNNTPESSQYDTGATVQVGVDDRTPFTPGQVTRDTSQDQATDFARDSTAVSVGNQISNAVAKSSAEVATAIDQQRAEMKVGFSSVTGALAAGLKVSGGSTGGSGKDYSGDIAAVKTAVQDQTKASEEQEHKEVSDFSQAPALAVSTAQSSANSAQANAKEALSSMFPNHPTMPTAPGAPTSGHVTLKISANQTVDVPLNPFADDGPFSGAMGKVASFVRVLIAWGIVVTFFIWCMGKIRAMIANPMGVAPFGNSIGEAVNSIKVMGTGGGFGYAAKLASYGLVLAVVLTMPLAVTAAVTTALPWSELSSVYTSGPGEAQGIVGQAVSLVDQVIPWTLLIGAPLWYLTVEFVLFPSQFFWMVFIKFLPL